ncbi:MAG: transaldolase, partial [Cylindrospermopsis raciborskii]
CDLLTISPALLSELQNTVAELPRKLDPVTTSGLSIDKISVDQATFERMHAADRMASDKLREGIDGFTKALISLEELLTARLSRLETEMVGVG